jgi:hypothetical membrane protein
MTLTITPSRAHRRTTVGHPLRLAGSMFFVLAAGFLTIIMLGASIAPAYDYAGGAISDLGRIGDTALLFNGTLVALGVLNIVGGVLFHRVHGRPVVLGWFLVAGIGAIGAGLFPLGSSGLHGLFALAAFLAFNIQALATAWVVRGAMRIISAGAGMVGLAFVVLMVIGDAGNPAVFGPIGHGGAERMIVYPSMLWLLALSGYLIHADEAAH